MSQPWEQQQMGYEGQGGQQVKMFDPTQFQASAQPQVPTYQQNGSMDTYNYTNNSVDPGQQPASDWDQAWNQYSDQGWYNSPGASQGQSQQGMDQGQGQSQSPTQNPGYDYNNSWDASAYQQGQQQHEQQPDYSQYNQNFGYNHDNAQHWTGYDYGQQQQQPVQQQNYQNVPDSGSHDGSMEQQHKEHQQQHFETQQDQVSDGSVAQGNVYSGDPGAMSAFFQDEAGIHEVQDTSTGVASPGAAPKEGPHMLASNSFSKLPHTPSPFDEIAGAATSETTTGNTLNAPLTHSRQSSFGQNPVKFIVGSEPNSGANSASQSPFPTSRPSPADTPPQATHQLPPHSSHQVSPLVAGQAHDMHQSQFSQKMAPPPHEHQGTPQNQHQEAPIKNQHQGATPGAPHQRPPPGLQHPGAPPGLQHQGAPLQDEHQGAPPQHEHWGAPPDSHQDGVLPQNVYEGPITKHEQRGAPPGSQHQGEPPQHEHQGPPDNQHQMSLQQIQQQEADQVPQNVSMYGSPSGLPGHQAYPDLNLQQQHQQLSQHALQRGSMPQGQHGEQQQQVASGTGMFPSPPKPSRTLSLEERPASVSSISSQKSSQYNVETSSVSSDHIESPHPPPPSTTVGSPGGENPFRRPGSGQRSRHGSSGSSHTPTSPIRAGHSGAGLPTTPEAAQPAPSLHSPDHSLDIYANPIQAFPGGPFQPPLKSPTSSNPSGPAQPSLPSLSAGNASASFQPVLGSPTSTANTGGQIQQPLSSPTSRHPGGAPVSNSASPPNVGHLQQPPMSSPQSSHPYSGGTFQPSVPAPASATQATGFQSLNSATPSHSQPGVERSEPSLELSGKFKQFPGPAAPSSQPVAQSRRDSGASLPSPKHGPSYQSVQAQHRNENNMSPATTLWQNPDINRTPVQLAPAAAPSPVPVMPLGKPLDVVNIQEHIQEEMATFSGPMSPSQQSTPVHSSTAGAPAAGHVMPGIQQLGQQSQPASSHSGTPHQQPLQNLQQPYNITQPQDYRQTQSSNVQSDPRQIPNVGTDSRQQQQYNLNQPPSVTSQNDPKFLPSNQSQSVQSQAGISQSSPRQIQTGQFSNGSNPNHPGGVPNQGSHNTGHPVYPPQSQNQMQSSQTHNDSRLDQTGTAKFDSKQPPNVEMQPGQNQVHSGVTRPDQRQGNIAQPPLSSNKTTGQTSNQRIGSQSSSSSLAGEVTFDELGRQRGTRESSVASEEQRHQGDASRNPLQDERSVNKNENRDHNHERYPQDSRNDRDRDRDYRRGDDPYRDDRYRPSSRQGYPDDPSYDSRRRYPDDYQDRPRSRQGYPDERPRSRQGYPDDYDRPRSRQGYPDDYYRPRSRQGYQDEYDRPRSRQGYPEDRPRSRQGYPEDRPRSRQGYPDDPRYQRPHSRQGASEAERSSSRPPSRQGQGEGDGPRMRSEYDYDYQRREDYRRRDSYRDDYYSRDSRYRDYDYSGRDYYRRRGYYDQYDQYDAYYHPDRYSRGYYDELQSYGGQQQAYDYQRYGYDRQYSAGSYGHEYDRRSHHSHSASSTPAPDTGADQFAREFHQGSRPSSRQSGYEQSAIYPADSRYYSYDQSYGYYDHYGYSRSGEETAPQRLTPVKFSVPHVCARFGPAGELIKVLPHNPAAGQPAKVDVTAASSLGLEPTVTELLTSFPGPLVKGDTHKNDVLVYCKKKARQCREDHYLMDRDSAELLWNFLELLVKQNGTFIGTDISGLLLDQTKGTSSEYDGVDNDPMSASLLTTSDRAAVNTTLASDNMDEQKLSRYRELYTYGQRKEALDFAMKNGLWGHALFISHFVDAKTRASILTRFGTTAVKMNDPLTTVYQLMSGRQPASVTLVSDERWGDWRPHLSIILANPSEKPELQRKSIVALGDTLAARGLLYASHFCYLMAELQLGMYEKKSDKIVLIGSSHSLPFSQFARVEAIQCTEVYEYGRSLSNLSHVLHRFQCYKFLYAVMLADAGFAEEAFNYCEVLASTMLLNPGLYPAILHRQVHELSSRLKFHDPRRLTGGEDFQDPEWIDSLKQIAQAIDDGTVLPLSGTQTPAYAVSTATGSEVGDLTSASQLGDAWAAQYQPTQQQQYQQQTTQYTAEQYNQQYAQGQYTWDANIQQWVYNTNWDQSQMAAGYTEGTYATYNQQQIQQEQPAETQQETSQPGETEEKPADSQPGGAVHSAPVSSADLTSLHASTAPLTAGSDDASSQGTLSPHGQPGSFDYYGMSSQAAPATKGPLGTNKTAPTLSTLASGSEKKEEKDEKKTADAKKPGSSWSIGNLFKKFTPKNEMKLPDDKDKSIVWDEEKKRWINKDADEEEEKRLNAPPPTDSQLKGSSALPTGPSAPPGGMPPPSGANRFSRQRGRGARNQYVDVLAGSSSKSSTSAPSNLFSVMPKSASVPANIFIPSMVSNGSTEPTDEDVKRENSEITQDSNPNTAQENSTQQNFYNPAQFGSNVDTLAPPDNTDTLSQSSSMSSLSQEIQQFTLPQSSSSTEPSAPKSSAPPPMQMFNPSQFQGAASSTGPPPSSGPGRGLRYGQRRAYPK